MLYLLHISPAVARSSHYLGYTRDGRLPLRLAEHQAGSGALLVRRALLAGSTVIVARLWPANDWRGEQRLKTSGHFRRHCPMCSGGQLADDCASIPPLIASRSLQAQCVEPSFTPLSLKGSP